MKILGALLVSLLLTGCQRGPGSVEAKEAWLRLAPPERPMAGYVLLRNGTARSLHCDRASSPDFGAIEIHRSLIENGMSRMLRDQVVTLPAGGEARLEPGGLHLMLFRPQRTLADGDRSAITLHCDGQAITAEFTARANPSTP